MKRRSFLKYGLPVAGATCFLQGQALGVVANNVFLKTLTAGNKSRKLVLIQLNGGNDGLNMFTPTDQYINLRKARPNIIIPENKLIRLTDIIGLHPSMTNFKRMYDDGLALIIQNVGYPSPSLSHFRSKSIFTSASGPEENIQSGWLARYLQNVYPDLPEENAAHPVAITIGAFNSSTCQSESHHLDMVLQNLNDNYAGSETTGVGYPDDPYGHELEFVAGAMQATEVYLEVIKEAASKVANLSPLYPSMGNQLADQLKIVARLIGGGLETQVYVLSLGGFDTHAGQVASSEETHTGTHANLLKQLADALRAFLDDLKLMEKDEEVIGLVYSEFGRRIVSNEGLGTDHGEAYPAILFGKQINPTVLGHNPQIPDDLAPTQNVEMEFDFRAVYASVFHEWFEADKATIKEVLYDEFEILPILKTSKGSVFFNQRPIKATVYPVPAADYLYMDIYTKTPHLEISLFNQLGQKVRVFMDQEVIGTHHQLEFALQGIPSGHYVVRIRSKKDAVTAKVIITD